MAATCSRCIGKCKCGRSSVPIKNDVVGISSPQRKNEIITSNKEFFIGSPGSNTWFTDCTFHLSGQASMVLNNCEVRFERCIFNVEPDDDTTLIKLLESSSISFEFCRFEIVSKGSFVFIGGNGSSQRHLIRFNFNSYDTVLDNPTLHHYFIKNVDGYFDLFHSKIRSGEFYHLDPMETTLNLVMMINHCDICNLTESGLTKTLLDGDDEVGWYGGKDIRSVFMIRKNVFKKFKVELSHCEITNASGFNYHGKRFDRTLGDYSTGLDYNNEDKPVYFCQVESGETYLSRSNKSPLFHFEVDCLEGEVTIFGTFMHRLPHDKIRDDECLIPWMTGLIGEIYFLVKNTSVVGYEKEFLIKKGSVITRVKVLTS